MVSYKCLGQRTAQRPECCRLHLPKGRFLGDNFPISLQIQTLVHISHALFHSPEVPKGLDLLGGGWGSLTSDLCFLLFL